MIAISRAGGFNPWVSIDGSGLACKVRGFNFLADSPLRTEVRTYPVRPPAPAAKSSHHPWLLAAAIFVLALFCYWPALRGGLVWDDDAHVTRPDLRSFAGLGRIWSDLHATQQYYPILHSAFWLEHRVWGDATLGYHLVNVMLHAIAAILLVAILRRLKVPGADLAGLLFVVHPVCVESVAWISEQKNTLSLVFYLLAARAYLNFDRDRGRSAATSSYVLASTCLGLALLTKSVTASLPAALLVIFWWQRGVLSWRRDLPPLVPWFLAALASGSLTAWVERKLIGAEGADFDLTFAQRGLLAGRVIWFYLGKLLWPRGLVFVYPRWDVPRDAPAWWTYAAAAVALTAGLWLLRRRWRGPLAAWLFFLGSLFPALGFVNVYPFIFSYVADHFQYLPSLGVITAVAAGAALLWARATRAVRFAGLGLGAALIALLSLLSRGQSRAYADLATLYGATIAQNPECWMAYNNLGGWYEARGDPISAIHCYESALRLRPDYADAHNNLGTVLSHVPGHLGDAITQYQAALRLKPDLAEVHYNLGNAWSATPGRVAEAIAEYQAALRLQPDHPGAHFNLGNAYVEVTGHLDDAIVQYQEALRLRPGFAEGHVNLGNAWSHTPGKLNEAIAEYQEALRLRPDYPTARFNLALALLRAPGRNREAVAQLEALLRVHPEHERARQLLTQLQSGSP